MTGDSAAARCALARAMLESARLGLRYAPPESAEAMEWENAATAARNVLRLAEPLIDHARAGALGPPRYRRPRLRLVGADDPADDCG